MKRLLSKVILLLPVILIIYSSLRISFYELPVYRTLSPPSRRSDGTYHYKGVIHIHTPYAQEGAQDIPKLLLAASKADLNFVIVTNYNNIEVKRHEGYRQGVMLIAGIEITNNYGHFLALDTDETLTETEKSDYFFKRVREKGGFSIISHPVSPVSPWTDRKNLDYEGIELISLRTYRENRFRPPFLRGIISTIFSPFNFRWTLLNDLTYPVKEIEFLSDALSTHPVFITCGIGKIKKTNYKQITDFCLNHIITDTPLTNNYNIDRKIILSAIRNGSLYIANDFIAPADNFFIYLTNSPSGRDRTLRIGIKDFPHKDAIRFKIYSNNRQIATSIGDSMSITHLPYGALRVEVYLKVPSVLFGSSEVLWINALVL